MFGHPEWIESQLVMGEEAQKMRAEIAALFRTKTRDEWIEAAAGHDVCLTPVLDIAEIETNPQIQARQMVYEQTHPVCGKVKDIGVPLKFSGTKAQPAGPAPSLGEDTESILKEIGYKPQEIETLRKEGVILIAG